MPLIDETQGFFSVNYNGLIDLLTILFQDNRYGLNTKSKRNANNVSNLLLIGPRATIVDVDTCAGCRNLPDSWPSFIAC